MPCAGMPPKELAMIINDDGPQAPATAPRSYLLVTNEAFDMVMQS